MLGPAQSFTKFKEVLLLNLSKTLKIRLDMLVS